jgi:hypothetical protein
MKTLITILLSTFIFANSFATTIDDGLKIAPNSKTATIEVRVNIKKACNATITIKNEDGVVVSTQSTVLIKGNNAVSISDISKLEEGTFTVSLVAEKTTMTAQFVNFK